MFIDSLFFCICLLCILYYIERNVYLLNILLFCYNFYFVFECYVIFIFNIRYKFFIFKNFDFFVYKLVFFLFELLGN